MRLLGAWPNLPSSRALIAVVLGVTISVVVAWNLGTGLSEPDRDNSAIAAVSGPAAGSDIVGTAASQSLRATGGNGRGCGIAAQDVATWQSSRRLIKIDTRSREQFYRFHIPGSFNLAVREVKVKSYLRDKPILLVSDGYRRLELQDACETLRSEGFRSVHFLDGGLTAWSDAGGELMGRRFLAKLDRLPPQAFESEVRRGNWVIIDVSEDHDSTAPQLIEADERIPFQKGDGGFSKRLADALEFFEEDRFVVLVDKDGSRHSAIDRALGSERPPNLFLLEGGALAYQGFRVTQELMLASARSRNLECAQCGPK